MFLLKDTTQWRRWGSNPLPFWVYHSTTEPLCSQYKLGTGQCTSLSVNYTQIPEVSSTIRELIKRSLTSTYIDSKCIKPDISTTSTWKPLHCWTCLWWALKCYKIFLTLVGLKGKYKLTDFRRVEYSLFWYIANCKNLTKQFLNKYHRKYKWVVSKQNILGASETELRGLVKNNWALPHNIWIK